MNGGDRRAVKLGEEQEGGEKGLVGGLVRLNSR